MKEVKQLDVDGNVKKVIMIKQKCNKKKKCKGQNNFFNPNYTSTQPNAKKRKLSRRQKKKGGILQTVPFYQMNAIKQGCAKSEGGSGCIKGSGSSWKVESNKTGKDWDATYNSKGKAQAALKAYHSK